MSGLLERGWATKYSPVTKLNGPGPWTHGDLGIHQGEEILHHAFDYGCPRAWARGSEVRWDDEVITPDHEHYHEICDEAEEWMNENIAIDGFTFGWENGEWGLWADEEEPRTAKGSLD